MPRSNRSRRHGRPSVTSGADEDSGLERLLNGWARTETRRGRSFRVQPISTAAAQKDYVCPGCGGTIEPGVAHVVVWREDGVLGDAADLAARRHWHTYCWSIA